MLLAFLTLFSAIYCTLSIVERQFHQPFSDVGDNNLVGYFPLDSNEIMNKMLPQEAR